MSQLVRIGLWVCFLSWLVASGTGMVPVHEKQPDKEAAGFSLVQDNEASILMPEQPPRYLFNQKNFQLESINETVRFNFLTLLACRLAPKNFDFQQNVRLTFHQNDYEATVPVYIRGHALLC